MTPIGIHKHYEIIDNEDNVIYQAPTIKVLSEISGFSDKALRLGHLKRSDLTVMKIEFIIFDTDEIHDVTETERGRLERFTKKWNKYKKEQDLKKAVKRSNDCVIIRHDKKRGYYKNDIKTV